MLTYLVLKIFVISLREFEPNGQQRIELFKFISSKKINYLSLFQNRDWPNSNWNYRTSLMFDLSEQKLFSEISRKHLSVLIRFYRSKCSSRLREGNVPPIKLYYGFRVCPNREVLYLSVITENIISHEAV